MNTFVRTSLATFATGVATIALAALAMVVMMAFTPASAASAPSNYEASASDYLTSRTGAPERTTVTVTSAPYEVLAKLDGQTQTLCWAVDAKIRTDLDNGATGRQRVTVLFYNDEPVAVADDMRTQIVRVDDGFRLANAQ